MDNLVTDFQVHFMTNGLRTKRKGNPAENNHSNIRFSELVNLLRNGEFTKVNTLRKLNKGEKGTLENNSYQRYKESLPAFRCGYRVRGDEWNFNGLVPIDVEDGCTTVPKESVVLDMLSCSGNGRFQIVRIPDPCDGVEWQRMADFVQEAYGLPSNKGQKNPDRCRIVSIDQNLFYNPEALPLQIPQSPQPKTKTQISQTNTQTGLNNNTSLSEFCRLGAKSLPFAEICDKMELLTYDSESMATAHQRKEYFTKWWNEYSHGWVTINPEILKTKDSIFYNSRGESFMVVDGKNAKEISNKQLHEIWYQLHPVEKLRPQFNTFYHRLLAETPSVDPWNNIFETAWSGEDQFANLSKYVNAERDTFIKDLSKHMIRGINQVYNDPTHRLVNRYVFCLQSEQKHIGKSTLVGRLTLSNVSGFAGEKDLSETSKEIKRSMCQLFNMIWEEVDSLTRKEVNGLKTLISLSSYSGRVLYSEQQSTKPRTATLWATVNPRDFLGSTDKRWIVHPINSIDFDYTDKVDFLDMWRQAFALWKANPNSGELTRDELESHEQTASEHINYSPLEQELMTIFSPDLKRSEMNVLSITDVIKVLQPSLDSIGRGHQTQVGFAIAKVFGDYKYPKCRYRQNKGAFYYLTKK